MLRPELMLANARKGNYGLTSGVVCEEKRRSILVVVRYKQGYRFLTRWIGMTFGSLSSA